MDIRDVQSRVAVYVVLYFPPMEAYKPGDFEAAKPRVIGGYTNKLDATFCCETQVRRTLLEHQIPMDRYPESELRTWCQIEEIEVSL